MNCESVRDVLYDLAFDLLDDEQRRAVEAHVASCGECRVALERVERERAMLQQWTVPAPPAGLADAAIAAARRKEATAMTPKPVEPELRWLGSRTFWRVAATVAIAVVAGLLFQWRRIDRMQARPQEAFVYGQGEMLPGVVAPYRVFVRNAASRAAVANAEVSARLVNHDSRVVWSADVSTDANGFADVAPKLPDDAQEGDYTLKIVARSDAGDSTVTREVKVTRSFRVMVSTDKPLYQPGQTIHIRTLALATADGRPVGGRETVIEVQDAKGNKVFKKKAAASDFGIASADFVLADQVNLGEYTVAAIVGDTTSERTVKVERYRLPKFRIDLSTDKGFYEPAATVQGELTACYTFGEPVAAGKVKVVAHEFIDTFREFATAEGSTDSQGRFRFTIPLKGYFAGTPRKKGDAFVSLEATVVDTAGHEQKKSLDRTVTAEPIRIELFPESGTLVQGVENVLYIVTAYPDGRPAKTTVTLPSSSKTLETSDLGIAKVKLTPQRANLQLTVAAEDGQGLKARVTRRLRIGKTDSVLLRPDKAVYRSGQTANLTVLSGGRSGRAFLDVVKDRRAVLTKAIDVTDGRGELALDLPPDLFGTLELHAYRITAGGDIVGDTRVIQVARADELDIAVHLDKKSYRPAEKAVLDFIVTRGDGSPTAAALSLAGVDEAVFALSEMRPGLERVYFALQEEILKPRYEIHARAPISPAQAIEPPAQPEPDLEEATVVLFAPAEGASPVARHASLTFEAKQDRVRQQKRRGYAGVRGGFALIPYAIYIACVGSLVAYGIYRAFRREPVEAPSRDRRRLRRRARVVSIGWVGAFYVPILLAILVAAILDRLPGFYHEGGVAGIAALFSAIVALGVLVATVIRVRECEASAAVPLLRKLLWAVPVGYFCAVAAVPLLAEVADERRGFLGGESAAFAILWMFPLAALVPGALAVAGNCATRRVSVGRWIWLALSRSVLAVVPCMAFLPFMMLGGGMEAPSMTVVRKSARAAGGEVMLDETITDAAPGEFPRSLVPLVDGGKAPARVRRHFPETLLWRPELITDADGRARLEVPLADSITTWRLAMSAVSRRGELGAATAGIRVFQPFFVDIDFPVALTQHDVVSVPVAIYNYLDEPQTVRVEVERADWFDLKSDPTATVRLGPRQVASVAVTLEAKTPGTQRLLVRAHGSELADAVERVVRVEPDGQPVIQTINGALSDNLSREVVIPEIAIDGANDLIVKIYPGAFSQVVEGLESIFRMPSGCFEQTSSTTYPNVLVLDYMRSTKQIRPELEMKALNFINLGYQRLLSFEVSGGGFSLYGKSPASPALTAYGLMEFADMAKVSDVDPALIRRTRQWLLDRRKSDGTWEPSDAYAVRGDDIRYTAYVAWAIASAGEAERDLGNTLDRVAREGAKSDDAYTLALCANALLAADHADAKKLVERLANMGIEKDKLVHWGSEGQGVTWSRGNVLDIETTALAARALLTARHRTPVAHKALAWLIEQKDGHGTWHSTQSTVHAMRALLAGAGASGGLEGDVNVTIAANGKAVKELTVTPDTADVFRLISLRDLVRKGTNTIALEASGKGDLAYQIVATHYVPWPTKRPEPTDEMSIDIAYDTTTLKANDTLTAKVEVKYNRPGAADMTIVDLGIPPGFQALPDSFETLQSTGVIERYSMTGRQVILYISRIAADKPLVFSYKLKAKFPVRVKTPASTVYEYYQPSRRATAKPVELRVL